MMFDKAMAKLIWFGILAGLVLGPGYYLYTRYASGHVVKESVVYGMDTAARRSTWRSPIPIHLEPSMNPIAFDFSVGDSVIGNEIGEHSNTYAVSLAEGDELLWGFDWKLGYRKTNRNELRPDRVRRRRGVVNNAYIPLYSKRLRVFTVSQAADYTFTVEPVREDEIKLHELTLRVKANVVQRNDALMYGGIFLLGMSIMIGWLRLKTLNTRRR